MKWTIILSVLGMILTCPPVSVGLFRLPPVLIFPVTVVSVLILFLVGQALDLRSVK